MKYVYMVQDAGGQIATICDNLSDVIKFLIMHHDEYTFPTDKTVQTWLDCIGEDNDIDKLLLYVGNKNADISEYELNIDYSGTGNPAWNDKRISDNYRTFEVKEEKLWNSKQGTK